MIDKESRAVSPGEMRLDAERMLAAHPNDHAVWLEAQRDFAAARREEAFAADDKVKANKESALTERFSEAAKEMRKLRGQLAVAEGALYNKLEIALRDAGRTEWRATHRHYKGTLYRLTGLRSDANGDEELVDGVEYDDAKGKRFFLHRSRWDSLLESGKPRYQALAPGEEA